MADWKTAGAPGEAPAARSGTIEFWFDFGSAYAYFAALDIEDLAARVGRRALWRPFMLGTAFKATGARGLSSTPLKKDYAARDWARLARARGIVFSLPPHHPSIALAATRAFYAIEAETPERAPVFALEILHRTYRQGLDSGNAGEVCAVAADLGHDPLRLSAALDDPQLKARVRDLSEGAVARGIFGSPFFIVDDEPFWGADRMAMMEAWIRSGGW